MGWVRLIFFCQCWLLPVEIWTFLRIPSADPEEKATLNIPILIIYTNILFWKFVNLFWKFVNSKINLPALIPELYTTSTAYHTEMAITDEENADVLGKFFSCVFVREPEST